MFRYTEVDLSEILGANPNIGEKVMEMVENRPTNYENIGVSKLLAGTFPPARALPTSKPTCMFRSLRVKLHIIGL